MLPKERTSGLGCIPEGRTVSYQCTVVDSSNPPIDVTIWIGSAISCSEGILLHMRFRPGMNITCGPLTVMSVGVSGTEYTSRLTLTATTELNGAMINCTLSTSNGDVLIGSDTIKVGAMKLLPLFHVPVTQLFRLLLETSLLAFPPTQCLMSVGVHLLVQWRVEWVDMCLVCGVDV